MEASGLCQHHAQPLGLGPDIVGAFTVTSPQTCLPETELVYPLLPSQPSSSSPRRV